MSSIPHKMHNTEEAARNICVVLATYNSDKYLNVQLESIEAQTVPPNLLLISDDGSTDSTLQVCSDFAKSRPWVHIVEKKSHRNLGPVSNFNALCREALERGCELIFFCDHDDIWRKNKISEFVGEFDLLKNDKNIGRLVHSELSVVDSDGVSDGILFNKANGHKGIVDIELQELLHRNTVTGCSLAVDSVLLSKALPFPPDGVYHDHWIALYAKCFARYSYIDRPLIDYRLHDGNLVGRLPRRIYQKDWLYLVKVILNFFKAIRTLKEFNDRYIIRECGINAGEKTLLKSFSKATHLSLLDRLRLGRRIFQCYSGTHLYWLGMLLLIFLPLVSAVFEKRK